MVSAREKPKYLLIQNLTLFISMPLFYVLRITSYAIMKGFYAALCLN